jgi:lysozyme
MTDAIHIAKSTLRDHEGLRLQMYLCPAGYNTVGYGFNLDANPVPHEVAEILLDVMVGDAVQDCGTFSYWHTLNPRRQAALIDMRYCLGHHRYRLFKRMHAALVRGDWAQAAAEILDSKFARQTGRRAENLANMMREG